MSVYQNNQWKLLEDGMLESIDVMMPEYWIDAKRMTHLNESLGNGKLYEWPIHMSEKTWIDMAAFEEAFRKALDFNKLEYDTDALDESFVVAHRAVAKRNA